MAISLLMQSLAAKPDEWWEGAGKTFVLHAGHQSPAHGAKYSAGIYRYFWCYSCSKFEETDKTHMKWWNGCWKCLCLQVLKSWIHLDYQKEGRGSWLQYVNMLWERKHGSLEECMKEVKWSEMKWNEMKWNEMKWNEMPWDINGKLDNRIWWLPMGNLMFVSL